MQKRFEGVNVNLQALAVQLFQWFSFKVTNHSILVPEIIT